jgi:hypothetical protein
MPIQVTQNIQTGKGIANGSYGTLHDIQFPKDTKYSLFKDEVLDTLVLLPDKPPTIVWIKLDRGHGALPPPLIDSQDQYNSADLFPIFPVRSYKTSQIQLPSERQIQLRITQLPFVSAIASTIYKVQGETLTSMVIADWKCTVIRRANKPQQGYILLSRPTSRNGLIILRPLTKYLTQYFRPPQEAIDEDNRLQQLHNLP